MIYFIIAIFIVPTMSVIFLIVWWVSVAFPSLWRCPQVGDHYIKSGTDTSNPWLDVYQLHFVVSVDEVKNNWIKFRYLKGSSNGHPPRSPCKLQEFKSAFKKIKSQGGTVK